MLAMEQVLWLSQRIGKGLGEGSLVKDKNKVSEMASLMVLVSA